MKIFIKDFPPKYYSSIFWVLAGVLFLLNISLKWVQVTSYSPEWGGFERNVIWGIQQNMQNKALYSDPESSPFAIIQYMPIYYYVVGSIGKILSVNPMDAHSVISLARFVSFGCCIFSSILLFINTRKFKVNK